MVFIYKKVTFWKLYKRCLLQHKKIRCLEKKIEELTKDVKTLCIQNATKKGSACSYQGRMYELKVYHILKHCYIHNEPFNTQKESDLGGSSSNIDILCNYHGFENIGIEIKKYNSPDWMQCCIQYDLNEKKWILLRGKHPKKCMDIFTSLIQTIELYQGEIPPFFQKNMTYEEWVQIKKTTNQWEDVYMDIPSNIIRDLYRMKGCHYIQISHEYGLYHLGEDICQFHVPLFDIEQQLRIRIKVHKRKNKQGYCNLSVTVACKPKQILLLQPSTFSLDSETTLPSSITFHAENNNFR